MWQIMIGAPFDNALYGIDTNATIYAAFGSLYFLS